MAQDHLGFVLGSGEVVESIYIPKFYDPELTEEIEALTPTHELIRLGDLIDDEEIEVATGDEIGKLAYGTGTFPFVRTSDIANWEIKADPKQGVSRAIYEKYAAKHAVRPHDLLFVRDGTYLIGSCALVSDRDEEIIYQSHIVKFRCGEHCRVSAPLLLAALSNPLVQRQIRAKQFTADIIDTIGNRYRDLILPVPRQPEARERIADEVADVVRERAELRERIRRIPFWAQGLFDSPDVDRPMPYETTELSTNVGSVVKSDRISRGIYLPKYYSPEIAAELEGLKKTHTLITIEELVDRGVLSASTGVEVGKMAYGTGPIPFVRTSDFANWELKLDPKHAIGTELYRSLKEKLDVVAEDVFLVRDGTYLVGSSSIVTRYDGPLTYCGGLYKLRVEEKHELDPFLLLALLNTPVARKQMRSKQFTRDVIDTLGKRLFEVVLPVPRQAEVRDEIATLTRETVERRAQLRERARELARAVTQAGDGLS